MEKPAIGIQHPCSVPWEEMNPTQKGAFCNKCSKEVIDFTQLSPLEIKSVLSKTVDQRTCVQMHPRQEAELNRDFELWLRSKHFMRRTALFSILIVFGLSLFSCGSEEAKSEIRQLQRAASNIELSEIDQSDKLVDITSEVYEVVLPPVLELDDLEELGELEEEEGWLDNIEIEVVAESISEKETVTVHEVVTRGDLIAYHPEFSDFILTTSSETKYDENGIPIPKEYSSKLYPNPAETESHLELGLPRGGKYSVMLYTAEGKFVKEIFHGRLKAGTRKINISLVDEMSGTYIVTIHSRKYSNSVNLLKL